MYFRKMVLRGSVFIISMNRRREYSNRDLIPNLMAIYLVEINYFKTIADYMGYDYI